MTKKASKKLLKVSRKKFKVSRDTFISNSVAFSCPGRNLILDSDWDLMLDHDEISWDIICPDG